MGGRMGGREYWRSMGGWRLGRMGSMGRMDARMRGWADGRMDVRMG